MTFEDKILLRQCNLLIQMIKMALGWIRWQDFKCPTYNTTINGFLLTFGKIGLVWRKKIYKIMVHFHMFYLMPGSHLHAKLSHKKGENFHKKKWSGTWLLCGSYSVYIWQLWCLHGCYGIYVVLCGVTASLQDIVS